MAAVPSAAPAPNTSPMTFVVVQVRHTLQQAGATGAKSAARLVIGATFTDNCLSTFSL